MSLSPTALSTLKAAETAGKEGVDYYTLVRSGGTTASAASLVRKGLLLRHVAAHGGVTWIISQDGHNMVGGCSGG